MLEKVLAVVVLLIFTLLMLHTNIAEQVWRKYNVDYFHE